MKWNDVKTKTQKKDIIKKALVELEKLVSAPEVKDIIDYIPIANSDDEDEGVALNKKGLRYMYAVRYIGMGEGTETEYYERTIRRSEYARFIEKFEIIPEKIKKMYKSLKRMK